MDLEEGLEHSDIIFIMVQTPNSGGNKFYDHSIVSNLLEKINVQLKLQLLDFFGKYLRLGASSFSLSSSISHSDMSLCSSISHSDMSLCSSLEYSISDITPYDDFG